MKFYSLAQIAERARMTTSGVEADYHKGRIRWDGDWGERTSPSGHGGSAPKIFRAEVVDAYLEWKFAQIEKRPASHWCLGIQLSPKQQREVRLSVERWERRLIRQHEIDTASEPPKPAWTRSRPYVAPKQTWDGAASARCERMGEVE